MKWLKRIYVSLMGFLLGFSALGVFAYLNWNSLNAAVFAGAAIAVLFRIGLAQPENTPKALRGGAIALLILAVLAYCFYVYSVLRVSECGFTEGHLYCLHRHF